MLSIRRRPSNPIRIAALAAVLLGLAGSAEPAPDAPVPPASPPPAAALPQTPAGARLVTLDDAVRTALRLNPTLDQATAALRRAEAVLAEARTALRPRVDGEARFIVQGPIPTFTLTVPPTRPGEEPQQREFSFGRVFTREFSISATYDVDPFGRLRDARRSAQFGVEAARSSLFIAQNELVFAVQNVYLAALRAQELIAVARESVDAAREQLRVAQVQFRAGTAPEFDVLRASVQVENVRQNLVTAEATYRRTLATLVRLLGLEPDARLELVPLALPPEPEQVALAATRGLLGAAAGAPPPTPSELPRTLEEALAEAFTRRPEVHRARWSRLAAEARADFERKGRRPRLTGRAAFAYNPDQTGLAVEPQNWSLVANLTIPIWDAGLSRARARQARADAAQAAAELQAARDAIAEEVRRALLDLEEAAERRRAASANTAQAREALRIARVRYTAGLAPEVEVVDAQVALTQARANEVNAAYDYLTALASLNRSLGRYAGETLAALGR